jgi:hypothetical protein
MVDRHGAVQERILDSGESTQRRITYRSVQTIGWLGFEAILDLDFDFDCTDEWE